MCCLFVSLFVSCVKLKCVVCLFVCLFVWHNLYKGCKGCKGCYQFIEPNELPVPSFAAIMPLLNCSIPGVAAPTKGVLSC